MKSTIEEILDDCLARIRQGKTVDECLAQYPHVRSQLEPLLRMAATITKAPDITFSRAYKQVLRNKLMTSLDEQPVVVKVSFAATVVASLQAFAHSTSEYASARLYAIVSLLTLPSRKVAESKIRRKAKAEAKAKAKIKIKAAPVYQKAPSSVSTRKLAVAVSAALILILLLSGILGRLASPAPSSEPESTATAPLTIKLLSGVADVESEKESGRLETNEEKPLDIGNRIKTSADSEALITFFEGSSIKLEPQTDITVQRIKGIDGTPHQIIIFQHLGKTESTVAQIVEGSRYEIKTDIASILATGTIFITEVDVEGITRVETIEGSVTVTAHSQEFTLPAGYEITINPWETGPLPVPVSPPEDEAVYIEENNKTEEKKTEPQDQHKPDKDLNQKQNKDENEDKENGEEPEQLKNQDEEGDSNTDDQQDMDTGTDQQTGEEPEQLTDGNDGNGEEEPADRNWDRKWYWDWNRDNQQDDGSNWNRTRDNRFRDYFDRIFNRRR
jgi:hypothetical protein